MLSWQKYLEYYIIPLQLKFEVILASNKAALAHLGIFSVFIVNVTRNIAIIYVILAYYLRTIWQRCKYMSSISLVGYTLPWSYSKFETLFTEIF